MKDQWTCPICQTVLKRGKDSDGEGVKRCPTCGSSWFIVLCRRPDEEWLKAKEGNPKDEVANGTI